MPGPTKEQFEEIAKVQSRITSENIIILMHMSPTPIKMPHSIDAMASADMGVVELKFYPQTVENAAIVPSLAHEYGHIKSYRSGTMRKMEKNDTIMMGCGLPLAMLLISEAGWKEIIAEEERAWVHARTMLESIGYTDWEGFERTMKVCIGTYYQSQKDSLTMTTGQKEHIRLAVLEDMSSIGALKKPRKIQKPITKTIELDIPGKATTKEMIMEALNKELQKLFPGKTLVNEVVDG